MRHDPPLPTEPGAETRVGVVLRHRHEVARDAARLERLGDKLDGLIEAAENLAGVDAALDVLEIMARTRARLIPLEREAFGLTDKDPSPEDTAIRTIRRVIVDPADRDAAGLRPAAGAAPL